MSFPKYKKYKDSGVEWLGEVPDGWEVVRLKFLCDIQTGDKDTKDAVDEGAYPFFVRSQTIERINSFTFDCEAVLTAGDGVGVGKVFHHYQGAFDFHQRVYMLNNFREVLGRFAFHFLRENFYKVALDGGAKSTVDSLRRPLFSNFPVSIPDLEEQRTIVEFVDRETQKIDDLVAEQRRLMKLLKEKRQAVISDAVTKGIVNEEFGIKNEHLSTPGRPVYTTHQSPLVPSGVEWLGDVPEGWEVMALRRCLLEHRQGYYSQSAYVDSGVKLLRITDLQDFGRIDFSKCPQVEKLPELEAFLLRPFDFVFARTGGAGTFGMVEALTDPAVYASYLIRFRFTKQTNSPFLRNFFLSFGFQEAVKQNIHGGVNQNIHAEDIKDQFLTLPPLQEQTQIAKFLDRETSKIDTLITESQHAINLLQERRTALISAAVTGQIDVREID